MKTKFLAISILVLATSIIALSYERGSASTFQDEIELPEGAWLVSSNDGQMATLVPMDWTPMDDFVYQQGFNDEETSESVDFAGWGSPDQTAFMYFMTYEDKEVTEWKLSLTRERILQLLNRMHTYNAGDIEIIGKQSMPGDSERLIWVSEACGCTGVITYTEGPPIGRTVDRPNTLWLFNAFYLNSHEEEHLEVFDYIFEFLTLPPEESRIAP